MIGFAAERLMELEVGAATGAGYGEKNPLRTAQRNDYRERDWETRRHRRTADPQAQEGLLFPRVLLQVAPDTKLAAKPEEQVSRIEQVRAHQHEESRTIDSGSKDNCANKKRLLCGVLRRAA